MSVFPSLKRLPYFSGSTLVRIFCLVFLSPVTPLQVKRTKDLLNATRKLLSFFVGSTTVASPWPKQKKNQMMSWLWPKKILKKIKWFCYLFVVIKWMPILGSKRHFLRLMCRWGFRHGPILRSNCLCSKSHDTGTW